ncbi:MULTISPECIES: holin [Gordonibacter]|uniref:Holin n=1 Tax=Gordonibacter faecis TaxID=3047475 RepID=A0ABT7DQV4_9ACTN|nr:MULTISPECIES: holin [unclassified Gordonibacter]MDJ1651617.1 holin [Gordonibacter sp. KGMB12511]HIW77039.1 hypothetical protein [Candidatus Gordonibacter avicola]
MNTKIKKWARAAAVRAIKTAAQTAATMIPVSAAMGDVLWALVGSTALCAGILSVLTSVAGIPEVEDGASVAKLAKGE